MRCGYVLQKFDVADTFPTKQPETQWALRVMEGDVNVDWQ